MTIVSVSAMAMMRDLYPRAGERIKQWVIELQREHAWEKETCPRVAVPTHSDNTGMPCRNQWLSDVPWTHLDHDCCDVCGDLHEATTDRPDIAAWRALKAARPPITSDREALSNEIAPDPELREHPLIAMIMRRPTC